MEDIKSIANAVQQSKLQALTMLVLSGNTLTDRIEYLVPLRNGHFLGFQSLKDLILYNTKLTSADLRTLSQALHLNKFPVINGLNINSNSLAGCAKNLLKCKEGCGLKSLEILNLAHTNLKEEDLKSLATALSLSKIRYLNLMGNDLHGIIKELFTDTALLHIQVLDLNYSGLGEEDILCPSNAVRNGKLPELREIRVIGNNFDYFESELFYMSFWEPFRVTGDTVQYEFQQAAELANLMSGLSLSPPSINGSLMSDLMFSSEDLIQAILL